MKLKLIGIALALLCFMAGSVFGSVVGKITGKITDADSQELLVGVTVSVQGTTMGAITDEDGVYTILNVPVGTYVLAMSAVGFAGVEISNVQVSADLATYQDIAMSSRAEDIGTTISVVAETPMVLRDKIASVQIIRADELLALPTRGFEDVVGIQSGVVAAIQTIRQTRGNRERSNQPELYVRGGRPSEVAFYVDGFSQQDPLTGLSTGNTGNNAIKEVTVISGGFPVEYGHVTSGIVNVITQSGGEEYSGTAEVVTDQKYGQNWYSASLGGPIPSLEKGRFYGSVERRYHADRLPSPKADLLPGNPTRLPSNSSQGWSYTGKVDYDFSTNVKLALSANGSIDQWQRYQHTRLFSNKHNQWIEDKNLGLNAKITHMLSAKAFYNLSASFFVTERFSGDGVHQKDLIAYGRPGGNPTNDVEALFRKWDDPSTPVNYIYQILATDSAVTEIDSSQTPWDSTWTVTATDTIYNRWVRTTSEEVDSTINGQVVTDPQGNPIKTTHYTDSVQYNFIEGGNEDQVYGQYIKRKSSYIGFNGDLNYELNKEHTIKTGFEFHRHTLRSYDHTEPIVIYQGVGEGTQDADRYGYDAWGNETDDVDWRNEAKHPIDLGLYVQDRIELRGLIVTAGLRLDLIDYKARRLRNIDEPLNPDSLGFPGKPPDDGTSQTLEETDLEDSDVLTRLSPRLGIAFPISDRAQMRVSYGKFFQRPNLQQLYVGYDYLEYNIGPSGSGYYTEIGNPNLEPPKTTAYEVGLTHQLGEFTSFDVNLFYRDVTGLVQAEKTWGSTATFKNQDFGTIKGLEFNLKMRRTRHIMFNLKYTLSYASGTGSFNTELRNVTWQNSTPPKQTAPLEYDQRHALVGIFDYRLGAKEGPKLGGSHILENFGVNIMLQASSGLPYTPVYVANELTRGAYAPTVSDSRNSANRPWTISVDFKLERAFTVGNYKVTPYLWVKNLLDRKNVVNAWEGTGKANTTAWLETDAGKEFLETYSEPSDHAELTGQQKYDLAQAPPNNYGTPRQIFFGLRMSF